LFCTPLMGNSARAKDRKIALLFGSGSAGLGSGPAGRKRRTLGYTSEAPPQTADPMAQAIWNALQVFDLLPTGFSNRDLRDKQAALRSQSGDQFTPDRRLISCDGSALT
jgi:hypothetical protein